MEFNEKLQELRKHKGLTQEALAESLYVSRAAVSKWEAGRGYPNIDSLKSIAAFFSVTVDELLSSGEVLIIAEEDHRQKDAHFRNLMFGLLDCSIALLFFLPFFGEKADGIVMEVSLLTLTTVSPWLKTSYFLLVIGMTMWGILTLALQNCRSFLWTKSKHILSMTLSVVGVCLFIISQQPYAAVFAFALLAIKALMLIKKQ